MWHGTGDQGVWAKLSKSRNCASVIGGHRISDGSSCVADEWLLLVVRGRSNIGGCYSVHVNRYFSDQQKAARSFVRQKFGSSLKASHSMGKIAFSAKPAQHGCLLDFCLSAKPCSVRPQRRVHVYRYRSRRSRQIQRMRLVRHWVAI